MQENINAPIFEVNYFLDSKSAKNSILQHHFAKSKTKTIIQIVILSAIAILFAVEAIIKYDSMHIFMVAVCLICIAFIVLTPNMQAKDLSAKFASGKEFKLKFYKEKVEIENGESLVTLSLSKTRISETEDYLYFEEEKRMFSFPKCYLSCENKSAFKRFLMENPQTNYKNYNKK